MPQPGPKEEESYPAEWIPGPSTPKAGQEWGLRVRNSSTLAAHSRMYAHARETHLAAYRARDLDLIVTLLLPPGPVLGDLQLHPSVHHLEPCCGGVHLRRAPFAPLSACLAVSLKSVQPKLWSLMMSTRTQRAPSQPPRGRRTFLEFSFH